MSWLVSERTIAVQLLAVAVRRWWMRAGTVRNPDKGEQRPPLEAVTRKRLKTQQANKHKCVLW